MTDPDDARDLAITAAIDSLVQKIMRTNAFSRKEAITRLVAFAENDEESPVFAQPARKRRVRRHGAEVRA